MAKKFSDYFNASEPVKNAPAHRTLALLRGRKEGFLRLAVMLPRPRHYEKLPESEYLATRSEVILGRMGGAQLP